MSTTASSNYTASNTQFTIPGAGTDQFDWEGMLQYLMNALEEHTHVATRGLGVRRLQTADAPASAGQVQVTGDNLKWWGATAGAAKTACDTDSTQTLTSKTLTTPVIAAIKPSAGNTLTLPDATDTVVTLAAAQALSSKRFTDSVFIGDTANAKNTLGLTINQDTADTEILSLKSSDVGHAATTLTEADTFGFLRKASEGTSGGGLWVTGIGEGTDIGLTLTGLVTTPTTAKGTGVIGCICLEGSKIDSGDRVSIGADGNLMSVRDYTTTRFILDADGDSHQDVGTAWTNFDDQDDVDLLTRLSVAVSRPTDPIRERFGEFLEQHRPALERLELVTFNDDGHHFVNMSRLTMLLVGAVRQIGERWQQTERRLSAIEQRLALLPGPA